MSESDVALARAVLAAVNPLAYEARKGSFTIWLTMLVMAASD